MDSGIFVTRWQIRLSGSSEARLSVPVIEHLEDVSLRAVYSADLVELLAGTYEDFVPLLPLTGVGFFVGEWSEIPAAALEAEEVYVTFALEADEEVTLLALGSPDLRIR